MKKISYSDKPVSNSGKPTLRSWTWDDTRAFLAVARYGTLTAAALELGVGIATLSRRVERLEKSLKLPLFIRQQSGYQLTEEGGGLVEKAEAMEAAATAFSSGATAQAQMAGKVRLATAENLATGLIIPALPEFCRNYPGIIVEVVTDIRTVNLHRRDADLAIRMVKPEQGNVSLRRLGTLGYGLYCNSDYTEQMNSASAQTCYEREAFITWSEMQSHLPAAQWVERILQGREPVLATTSLAAQVAATKAGLGLAVLPHFIALDAGLVCVASDIGVDQPIYLVIQSDLKQSRRTRAFADFLVDLVGRNRARLRG